MRKILILLFFPFCLAAQVPSDVGIDIGAYLRSRERAGDQLSFRYDIQYTTGAFTEDIDGLGIYGMNCSLSDSEIDDLIGDIEASEAVNGELTIKGDQNGSPTSGSAADRATLISRGWALDLNGIRVTGFSYSNTGQTFTVDEAITTMVRTNNEAAATTFNQIMAYPFGDSPISWFSIGTTSGDITGTPLVAGDYAFLVRSTGYTDYSYYAQDTFHITVNPAAAGATYLIDLNTAGTSTNITDPEGKYWNSITTAFNGSVANIVDITNSASTITVTVGTFNSTGTNGNSPTDGVYPNEAWSTYFGISNSQSEIITISGLDNGTNYDVEIFCSRNTANTNRTTDFTIGGVTKSISATNPGASDIWDEETPSGGEIVISGIAQATHFGYANFLKLTID